MALLWYGVHNLFSSRLCVCLGLCQVSDRVVQERCVVDRVMYLVLLYGFDKSNSVTITSTGIPFQDLRFSQWCC
jgi:hypothetical protein